MNNNVDLAAMPSERFVNRVIDNFEDHVMQASAVVSVANVHTGTLPDRV